MEKEINIAAILKDKPSAKLWSSIIGDCTYSNYYPSTEEIVVNFTNRYGEEGEWNFHQSGRTLSAQNTAEVCLFPSKQMRSWEKFAWKKGDVLVSNAFKCLVMFSHWTNDEYTKFEVAYLVYQGDTFEDSIECTTDEFSKTSEENTKECIKKVEAHYGGKLNLETLEIEKPQFKDGDIVVADYVEGVVFICICNKVEDNFRYCHARMNSHNKDLYLKKAFLKVNLVNRNPRPATDSEKLQLFEALAKENKAWDTEKKTIVDLPKKCEFKPMDWCLMRFRGTNKDVWKLCQFGFIDCKDKNDFGYCAIGGNWFDECIPYNDQTAHLLGTTDDWKGGEE